MNAGGRFPRVLCGVLLVVPACSPKARTAGALVADAAEREFGDAAYGCEDTIAVAKKAGVDYVPTVDRCLNRDEQAMHALFWLTRHAGFDAASSQGHAAVLGSLLRQLGDRFFGACLAREPPDVQDAVRDDIAYDFGLDPPEIDSVPTLMKDFPRTFPATYEYGRSHYHIWDDLAVRGLTPTTVARLVVRGSEADFGSSSSSEIRDPRSIEDVLFRLAHGEPTQLWYTSGYRTLELYHRDDPKVPRLVLAVNESDAVHVPNSPRFRYDPKVGVHYGRFRCHGLNDLLMESLAAAHHAAPASPEGSP